MFPMTAPVIVLACVSFCVLALSLYIWKLTSSRSNIFNGIFGSTAILFAACFLAKHQQLPLTYGIPFVISMMFFGRGIGTLMRVRKEPDLRTPGTLMCAVGAIALVGAITAFFAQ